MKNEAPAKQTDQRPFMEELERRLLLSADVFGVFAGNAVFQDVEQPDSDTATDTESDQALHDEAADHQSRELIIIDAATPDYEKLLADLTEQADEDRIFEVEILDPTEDGIGQITDLLSEYSDLDAMHIISHGSEGSITLGSSVLDYDALIDNARDIEYWGDAFSEDGDLLIYGCNLAATGQGQDLVDALGRLTETDVAASEDLTGSDALGGDWDLEYQRGDIEASVAVSAAVQESWDGVLAAFAVDTTADTSDANPGDSLAEDGSGNTSIRAAIEEANALGGADTITIGAGTFTLSGGQLSISSDMTITGAGADVTFIDGASLARIFDITSGTVTISNLTIMNGDAGAGNGGGVQVANGAIVNLDNVALTGNSAFFGGAIINAGTLDLTNVTIANNTGTSDAGGVWSQGNFSSLTATNVTISGNSTPGLGGGLYIAKATTLTNVTITDNSASSGAGIYESGGAPNVTATNSIIAGNKDTLGNPAADLLGDYISGGNNIIGDVGSASGFTDGVNGDQVGTAGSPIDPLLGALADNGGPTQTHALQTGSTAIDGGTNTGAPTTDQRGTDRDASVDIGAYEYTVDEVSIYQPWTNLAVSTDRSTTISADHTVTAAPGSDRLLVVTMVTRFGFDQTIDVTSATFGGVQLHEIVEGSSNTTRNGVWMGYLLDSEIPDGENLLSVSFTSTVSDPTGTKLLAATYVGVDQTTPVNDSSANNTKADAPISFGSQIDYNEGGEVVYVASYGGNTNTNTTEPAGYSKIYTNEWSGLLMTTIGHMDDTSTAGSSAASTAVDFEGTDANHSLAVVALNAVPVDNPAIITGDVSYTGNEGDAVAGDLNATDPEGLTDGTYFTITSGATNGTASVDPETGAWTFTPTDPNWFGSDSFEVTVTDDLGGTTTQTISVTVTGVEVIGEQKISDISGGLNAVLDDNDRFGTSVATIGDLDGDGIDDIVVGAQYDDDGGINRGAVYILFLNADGTVKSEQKISDTAGGLTATLDDSDLFGIAVAGIGDLDGDGINDIAVGVHNDDDGGTNRGAVHILFLNADGTVKSEQKISDTTGGLTAPLDDGDAFGNALAGIGDLDGDGVNDLAVGAYFDDDGGVDRGAVHILFLNADGTVKAEQKISATAGGLTATLDNSDYFGNAVAGIGDLDGDGVNDIVVGAQMDDDGGADRGAVHVLFLNADGTVKAEQKISNTSGGLTVTLDDNDIFGVSLTSVGDLDGDNVNEIVIGAMFDDDGGTDRGAVYVVYLNTDGTVRAERKISDTTGGLNAALDDGDRFGRAVAGISDLDGDGVDDLVVAAQMDDDGGSDRGALYVLNMDAINRAPIISSDGGSDTANVNVAENTTAVTTVAATDVDPDTLTYSISGGADGALFSIDSSTGVLTFIAAPDYEGPLDADANNVYEVIVHVADGNGGFDTQTINVTVTNVAPTAISATGAATVDAGSSYTLNLSANEDVTSWTINWGDGTVETIVGNPSSVTHTYTNAGFTNDILVSATDVDGTYSSSDLLVTSRNTNTLFWFDSQSGALVQESSNLDGLTSPVDMVVGPDGNLYVGSYSSDEILRYDINTGVLIDTFVTTGSGGLNGPTGLAFGSDGNLYVGSGITNEILRYDASTGAFIDAFVVAGAGGLSAPGDVLFGPDGNLYVVNRSTNDVMRFDGTSGAFIDNFAVGTAVGIAFGPDGNLYVTTNSSSVDRYDGATGTFIDTFVTSGSGGLSVAKGIQFGPDGNLYVNSTGNDSVMRYDGNTGAYIDTIVVSGSGGIDNPFRLAFKPTQQVLVTGNAAPVITSDGAAATANLNVAENTTAVTTVTSSDADGGAPVYSIVGGADAALFSIDSAYGVLTFVTAPDFEIPADANGDNVHEVIVQVADGNGGFDTQTINVTVTDVEVAPTASNHTVATAEDTPYVFTAADFQFADLDPSDSLQQVQITALESVGSLKLSGFDVTVGQIISRADIDAGNLTYEALPNEFGTAYDSFEFRVHDGTQYSAATATITFLDASFDTDAEGFSYADDVFGTSAPAYSSGSYNANSGLSGGGLLVLLSGRSHAEPFAASGGWSDTFTLDSETTVTVSLSYRMWMGAGYDVDEFAEAILEIDGIRYGSDLNNSLLHVAGDGNGGVTYNSGPQTATFDITLAAGTHTITVGGYDNQSTGADEWSEFAFDDISITRSQHYTTTVDVNAVNDAPSVSTTGAQLGYAEGDGAVAIDPGVTVADVDSPNLTGATVQIVSGFVSTEDTLNFVDQLGITGSYDAGTGILTLTGTASVADYQTALRSITYQNSSEIPDTTNRIINFQVTDGAASSAANRTITVASINDDPYNAGSLPTDVTVMEDTMDFVDLSTVNLADVDASNGLMTVTLMTSTGGLLWASSDFDVTVFGTGTGTLTLSGGVADLNNFFSSAFRFQYRHATTHTAGDNADTIQVSINDNGNTGSGGSGTIVLGTVNVDITPVNDAPVRTAGSVNDLTVLEDSGLTSLGLTGLAYGPGGGSDESGQTLTYEVTVIPDPNFFGKIYLADGTTQVGTGFYTLAQIRGMQFEPVSDASGGPSFFSFRIQDSGGTPNGGSDSMTESIQLNITPVNDVPVVTTSGGSASYSEQNPAISIDDGLTISDPDGMNGATSSDQFSAVIRITGNYSVDDILGFTDTANIQGSLAGDTLTLSVKASQTATIADFEAAMRNVTFYNGSDTPGTLDRTISFTFDDGIAGSNTGVKLLQVIVVNDAPVLDTSGFAVLTDIDEGNTNNFGDLVSAIIASAGGDPITDIDSGPAEGIAVTGVDDSNGTWEYSTDGGLGWTAFGAVSDSAAVVLTDSVMDRIRFVPDTNFNGPANFSYRAWDGSDANVSGTIGVDVSSNGGNTPFSAATETADITVNPVQIVLYFSTFGDVTTSGAPGVDSWTSGDLIGFGDPGLSFEPGTTDGTLYTTLNLGSFATDGIASINAMHFVSRDITVGSTNSIALQTGDLLLATDGNETFTGSDLVSLNVGQRDLFVFRPDTPGNYSSGSFFLLLDTFASNSVTGVSLVEQNTTVGDVTLTAGTFIFNAGNSRDILHFSADDVGFGTTTGATSTLIDGGDIGFDNQAVVIAGLDLVEGDVTVAGTTVSAGNILVTLDSDDSDVGSNHASFLASDIFRLDVITTTMGAGTSVANAYAFIEGADVNLEAANEEVSALSLDVKFGSTNTDPVIGLPGGDITYTEGDTPTIIDAGATVSDADALNFFQGQLRVDFTAGADSNDRLAIFDEGNGAGQVGVAGNTVMYGGATIGRFTGGNNGSQPLVITFNSGATEEAVQAVMRNITYENTSNDPTTTDRTVRFILSDGEGGTSNIVTKTIHVIAINDPPVITSDGGNATAGVNVAENSTAVTTVAATDAEGDAIIYSISGGVDAGKFTIDDTTGELTFIAAPDFENPTDLDFDNVYEVEVTATATGGSDVQIISVTVTDVDEVPPVVTVTSISTSDNTPQLSGTVDDPTATVEVTVNGTTYTATNNGDGTWTLADNTIAPALADGTYDVSVTAADGAGNVGTDGSIDELMVDSTAPIVTVTGLTTVDNTPALTGSVNDPAATVEVTVNGTMYTATNNGDGTWTLADNTIAPALVDGTYDVSVTATDSFGNAGTDGSIDELIVDTTAPIVTVTGLTTTDNTPALTGTVNDPTATVDVTVNGTTYTATNNGDGTWTLADNSIAPALADGTYDVSVIVTDGLGNAGIDASIDELVVDTTAPIVTVTALSTTDNTPQLSGMINDPTATVDVTVNGPTYTATNNGDGTWTLADNSIAPALADGTYDVSVTATDSLGNAGTDGSVNELTVDTTAPVVTVTGLSTTDVTPQLTGTVSDPTATVDVTVNGTTYTATNNGDGTWTLADNTIAPALADGTYDVSVTATDSLGNAGTDASINELTVDTTAPIVTVTSLATVDNTPQLSGTVNDPTATVDVTVNGTTYTATNNGDGTWTLVDNSIAPALADGTYDVSVTATDSLGNAGTDGSIDELTVDTTAPIVTVTGLNTADATPQLTGTVNDPTATVDVTVNGTTYTATNNGDGTWTLADDSIAPVLADGTYDISVTATDSLGNAGTDASVNELVIDTTAPIVTVTALSTVDNTPQLSGTVNDPGATVDVTVNGTTYTATNNGDGTWTLADNSIAPALADGTYDVSVSATDSLGNAGSDASSDELIVDTTAPIVTVTGLSTTDATPQLTGTVNDPTAAVDVTVNGTMYTATNNGDGTWTLADNTIAPALADGTYDVSVTATDSLGNASSDGSIDELTVDTTAPIVTVTGLNTVDATPQLTGTVNDPTATVDVTVNGTNYAATNNGDGTWTLADNSISPALADGTYDVSVTATDSLGNAGSDGSIDELTVDTTAPIVTVTDLATVDNTPALTGTVNDPTASVDVTVNGTTYAATNNGDGTWTLADNTITLALADGTYDVSVTATDALGNAGTDGSTNELTVDATAPIVTVTGLMTVDNTPALTGTVNDPSATVDVTVNGTTYAATNNGDGTWTLADNTIAPALADGTYDVSVTATDALSNVGTDASVDELTVDTTAPIVTVTGLSTADATPQLTGTVSDPTATVDVIVNGTTYAATNNGDGTWTLADNTIAPALADGTYDVSVTATDALGNAGSDGSTSELTVDTTAPVVTVTGLSTADNTPVLTGTVSDPTATVDVIVNGTTYAATNNGDGTWTLADNTIAPALADGTYDVSVTATDALGNAGSDGSTNELTVDTTAPIVTVTGLNTTDATPQLTGTVSDPTATIDVTVNGTTYSATNNGDGTWTLADNTIAPALSDGTYDVSVTATDSLGNAGTDASINELTVDTTAPIVTVTGLNTTDATPQLTGTVSDPIATVDVTVNGTTYAATNNGDGTWTLADNSITPALADGTYDVSVTATDGLGNAGSDGSTNELTVDTTAPIVTVTGLSTTDNTPQLTGTVNDPTATVDVTINGTTYTATNNGDGTWTLADNAIAPALADGMYDVSVTATDSLGNASSDVSIDELTIDTTAPIVTVTGLNTVDATPQLTGTVNDPTATVDVTVNGTTYGATNNGDGTWTLADNSIAPALADSTYDVSVMATDSLGNASTDGSIDELVVDTTAPIVTVTALSTVDNTPQLSGTVNDPTATVEVTVNGTTYTATNNGDGTWTLADNSIAPALADGTYDVSVSATDSLGNAGSDASIDELVVDTTAPIVTVTGLSTSDATPQLTGTVSDATATVEVTVNGTTYTATNNGDSTWTLADNSIAPALADGTYDVSVTATDSLGNAGSDGSIDELVVDTTAPIVTVTSLSTVDNTPQLSGTVSDPTATVDVTVNGTTHTATNNGDGTWTLADNSIAPALADGTYDVSVTATDSLGNAGTDGSIDELVVDTTAPIVTVSSISTTDNTPALNGTISDWTASVEVTVNGTTYTATNNGDGTWTLADNSIAPALADGTYDVSVTATDSLGNAGADGSTNELTVDTTAPIVTVTGLITADNTPALTGAVSDPTATVAVTVNGTTYTATNNGDGTWTLADNSIAPALADGTYDVSVTATDSLGNAGTDASVDELVVDTTAPIVTVTGLSTTDNTPALNGTVSDPTAIVDVTVNGTTYTATNNGDGTWTLADNSIAPALADGTYDVSVTATDSLGNAGSDGSIDELVVDTTAPIVTVTGLTTTDNTPALTGTVSDPTATVDVTVNGTTYAATNNGDGTWTLADNSIAPALADGTYDVSVTATDSLGNAGTDGSTNELTVDTTAPVVTVTGLSTIDAAPQLTGTVNDPAATVDVTVNGTTYSATNNGDGTWTLADNTIAPALADGTYDVSVTATDSLGNVGTDGSVNELTVDTTAPIVTVTGLTTVDNTPALTGTVSDPTATVEVTVNGTTYAATNNGDGTWTLADNSIAPALADGTYDVSVTATDSLGNAGTDGSIDELIVDTTAPIVTVTGLSTTDATPQLTGTVNDPTATVDVTVNGTTYAASNNGDGTWTLADNTIAPALANGTYDVSVTATDSLGNAGTDASIDELNIINNPPVAVDDAYTTDEDLSFTSVLGVDDLLLNDSDADGDSMTVNTTPVSGPMNGTLVLNSDGTFTYTPNADFNGTDSFVYEVNDGNGGIAQATVTITVNPVNDNPAAVGDSFATNEDQSVTAVLGVDDLLLNDTDIDGDLLTVNSTPLAGPTNGTLVLNSDGTFTYTPDADFNGTDAFTYQVSDGNGGTSQAIVTIAVNPVNDAPNTAGIADIDVNEDAPDSVVDLLGAFADVDDPVANVTFTVTQNTNSGLFNSTSVDAVTGTLTLNYTQDAYGSADITIRATDPSGGWVETTFTVNVNPVNDIPVIGAENFGVDEDVSFTAVLGVDDLLLNDSDADGDLLTVNTTPVSGPNNGVLLLNGDGTFTYTPYADFNGTDSFTYEVTDGNGGIGQGIVTITINPVNDAPVSGSESMTTDEDAPLIGIAAGINDLLANDMDTDGDALTVNTTPVIGPTYGTLVLNSDGSFTYTPYANFSGTDAFTYQVADASGGTSQAVVTILVNPVNDAPVAGRDAMSVEEGSAAVISEASLLANDTDADGDALQVVNFSQPNDGSLTQNADGSLAYTPAPGFSGVDSFTYTVADASGARDSVLVMVSVTPAVVQTNPVDESDPAPPPSGAPPADDGTGTSTGQDSGTAADKDDGNTPPAGAPADEGNQEQSAEPVDINADLATSTPVVEDSGLIAPQSPNQYSDLSGRYDGDVKLNQTEAAAPPKFLYDALQAVQTAFDIEIPDFAVARLNELPIWEALDAMKREMSATEGGGEKFGGVMVMQVSTGMSLALSAGIMSWILRGGALASALLSTMPMWQGFDPLPILLGKKKRKKDEDGAALPDDETPLDSEVDRLFEAAAKSGFDTRPRGSAK